jgi:hypothetical protein
MKIIPFSNESKAHLGALVVDLEELNFAVI